MSRSFARPYKSGKWRSIATGDAAPPAPPAPDQSSTDTPEPRTYTAEDLAAMSAKDLSEVVGTGRVRQVMEREKNEGKRSAERTVLEQLGYNSLEDVKAVLTQKQQEDQAKMSEAERASAQATTLAAQAEADRRQAAADRQAAQIERALIRKGISDDALGDAIRLIQVEPDADEATITSTVESLKERHPSFFTASNPAGPPAPSGGPGGAPPRPAPNGDPYQRGAERAKKYAEASGG